MQEANENFEDASNELILTDEEVVRFQIGEVFAHVPKDEVEMRIEQMTETTTKHLEKLKDEKDAVVVQMADLKKVLYAKFKDSINLEEDWIFLLSSTNYLYFVLSFMVLYYLLLLVWLVILFEMWWIMKICSLSKLHASLFKKFSS